MKTSLIVYDLSLTSLTRVGLFLKFCSNYDLFMSHNGDK